jgi:hypothetical protein
MGLGNRKDEIESVVTKLINKMEKSVEGSKANGSVMG